MARLAGFRCGRRCVSGLFRINCFIWNDGGVMRIVVFVEERLGQYDGVVTALAKASPGCRRGAFVAITAWVVLNSAQ